MFEGFFHALRKKNLARRIRRALTGAFEGKICAKTTPNKYLSGCPLVSIPPRWYTVLGSPKKTPFSGAFILFRKGEKKRPVIRFPIIFFRLRGDLYRPFPKEITSLSLTRVSSLRRVEKKGKTEGLASVFLFQKHRKNE